MFDIRKMPKHEAMLVLNKVFTLATMKNTDIRFDDEESDWYVTMNMSDGSRFVGNGRGTVNDGVDDYLYLEYMPPKGGHIRFDLKVVKKESAELDTQIINKFNDLLMKFGGSGKTFVKQFENLDVYKPENATYEPEFISAQLSTERNWLQKLGLLFMRWGS